MAEQLESSSRLIEASSRELGNANEALERRRRYIETVLESIPTGVVSIDGSRNVTLANAAFSRMFHPDRSEFSSPAALADLPLRELLPAEVLSDLEPLLRRADRMGLTAANMEIALPHAKLNVAVTVSALEHPVKRLGYVLVFEDLIRLASSAKAGGMARGRASSRPRDQESVDPDRSLRRTYSPSFDPWTSS